MWANAQRDGHPVKNRWHPLFNTEKFGWCPLPDCRAVILPRCETCWNSLGCIKLANRSKLLVGQSSPYCGDMWKRYCCLSGKIWPNKVVWWCTDGEFLAIFCVLHFQRAVCTTFQTCILNSH